MNSVPSSFTPSTPGSYMAIQFGFFFSPPTQVLYTKNSLPSITYYYFSEFPDPKEYNRGVGCVQPIVKRNTLFKILTYDWNNYIFCYT